MSDDTQNAESHRDDEFYTGYLPEAPTGIARHIRKSVTLAFVVVAAAAALVAFAQRPFAVAFFEFGNLRTFEGVIEVEPAPILRVDRPAGQGASRYLLVGEFKHGADDQVRGLHGRPVKLEGTLVHRDDQTMIEVVAGSVQEQPGRSDSQRTQSRRLGIQTLRGEIVDSKCHYGVMKPGDFKPHRACATLCIRGGIPPVFVVRNEEGRPLRHLLLVGSDGRGLHQEVLPFVADPLEITGEVRRQGDLWILAAEPDDFRRLD